MSPLPATDRKKKKKTKNENLHSQCPPKRLSELPTFPACYDVLYVVLGEELGSDGDGDSACARDCGCSCRDLGDGDRLSLRRYGRDRLRYS